MYKFVVSFVTIFGSLSSRMSLFYLMICRSWVVMVQLARERKCADTTDTVLVP